MDSPAAVEGTSRLLVPPDGGGSDDDGGSGGSGSGSDDGSSSGYGSSGDDDDGDGEAPLVFANTAGVPKDLRCPICLGLIQDPVITKCGHTYCRACIAQEIARSEQCAVCRSTLRLHQLAPNLLARSLVDEQEVHCRWGCTWTDEVGWVVDEDGCAETVALAQRQQHERDCGHRPVLCPFSDRCGVFVQLELDAHLEVCPHRESVPLSDKMQKRQRRRTDVYQLFTYLTVWIMLLYFLYTSHTFGLKIRQAGGVLVALFSLPIVFIGFILAYEAYGRSALS